MSPPKSPVIIYMSNSQITYTNNGVLQTVSTPNAAVVVSPQVRAAYMVFDTRFNTWLEIVPANTSGNVFLNGVALPLAKSLPGGVTPVTWTASFITNSPGVTFNWQWSAAAYRAFNSDYNRLGVKSLDDKSFPPFNSDAAGTPEFFKSLVTAGATGNGGSNYTGTLNAAQTITPCSAFPTPTPSASPTPTAPPFNALVADNGFANPAGQVTLLNMQAPPAHANQIGAGFFQLDSSAYVTGNTGILSTGGLHELIPFTISGTTVNAGTPFDLSPQCANPLLCFADAVVMPNPTTAVVALGATGSNYLLQVNNVNSTPSYAQLAINGTFGPEDTAGLAMSPDAKVLVTRGGHLNVFYSAAPPANYTEVNQIAQSDPPDVLAEKGREGVTVFKPSSGDYEMLVTGTTATPQGTLWLFTNLTGAAKGQTSTLIAPSKHAYSVVTDGRTAFVGTDAGIAIVPGVDSQTFGATTSTIVNPIAGMPGTSLVQISSVTMTPDNKWLVVMGLPATAGATTPGGQGYIDVLPITYGTSGVTLGPAVESVPATIPNDDQLLTF
jgi:hypothetical protein